MRTKLWLPTLFLLIILITGCDDNNSGNDNIPSDFNLLTSECPTEDIKYYPNQQELRWMCIPIEGGEEDYFFTLSEVSFISDCFTLESKADNWCKITPIGRAMFTATHIGYDLSKPVPPPPDENGCRIDENVRIFERVCELKEY